MSRGKAIWCAADTFCAAQYFCCAAGKVIDADHYRLPLSEGVVDRTVRDAGYCDWCATLCTGQPSLYAMGMGGWDKPLPKMLKALKWRMCEVPFHFKVVHPAAFLRNIRVLRTSALKRSRWMPRP